MSATQRSASALSMAGSFKRVSQFLMAGFLLVTMVGCASSLTRIDTWEGDPDAAAQAATLKAPGAVNVARVNGRNMSSFLVDDLPLDYGLLPGDNEVVFTHKTIWAKSGVVENDEAKVHVYVTEPQVVRFDARAGEVYQFQIPKLESRAEAEQMAENFEATVVTADGRTVASSEQWSPEQVSARTPIPAGAAVQAGEDSALDRLKAVWATATEEEKKAFLRWAFE